MPAPTQSKRPTIDQTLPPQGPHVGLLHRAHTFTTDLRTRGQFAYFLLPMIGVDLLEKGNKKVVHENDLLSLMAWAQAEGQAGKFNLLNCTQKEAGSWDFNGVHVQNYATFQTSLKAHADTINYGARHDQHGYQAIRHALHTHSDPRVVLEAVEASAWGTGGLGLRVYETTPNAMLLNYRFQRLVQ